MKLQRIKFKLIAFLLFLLFVILAVWGGYSVTTYGNRWFSSKWNSRIRTQKQNVVAGDLYDRSGVLLASTINGTRTYADDEQIRKAVVHLVGDSLGRVANGADSFFSTYLYGFQTSFRELCVQLFKGITRKGESVSLTIDGNLSKNIVRLYQSNASTKDKSGAVVVMNYMTGQILALVSLPVFDPLSSTDETELLAGQPYWNRATQSQLPPGSTFKIITAASALENLPQAESLTLACSGILSVKDSDVPIHDWNYDAHGNLTLRDAFRTSCNSYFAQLALVQLGDSKLKQTALSFGFNENFLFHDIVLSNSSYPETNRTYREIAMSGIGQSAITVSPLHLCMITSAIANDGVMMEPRLLNSVTGASGTTSQKFDSRIYRKAVSPSVAQTIKSYMRAVVETGTGTKANVSGMTICGKTGSAESESSGSPVTHGWFVGFNDDPSLPLAVCVLVESIDEGTGGGSTAAPVAGKIFAYLKNHPELARSTGSVSSAAATVSPSETTSVPDYTPAPAPTTLLDPFVDAAGHLGLITTNTPDPNNTPSPTGILDAVNGIINTVNDLFH